MPRVGRFPGGRGRSPWQRATEQRQGRAKRCGRSRRRREQEGGGIRGLQLLYECMATRGGSVVGGDGYAASRWRRSSRRLRGSRAGRGGRRAQAAHEALAESSAMAACDESEAGHIESRHGEGASKLLHAAPDVGDGGASLNRAAGGAGPGLGGVGVGAGKGAWLGNHHRHTCKPRPAPSTQRPRRGERGEREHPRPNKHTHAVNSASFLPLVLCTRLHSSRHSCMKSAMVAKSAGRCGRAEQADVSGGKQQAMQGRWPARRWPQRGSAGDAVL